MTVVYVLEPTGRTPHEVRERLLTTSCPSCSADWTRPQAALPRHSGGREYRCEACGVHHRAQEVDRDGRPVPTPTWSSPRRQHEEGPAATHEG